MAYSELGAEFDRDGSCFSDLNECLFNNGGCSTNPNVTCTNTVGSRTCGELACTVVMRACRWTSPRMNCLCSLSWQSMWPVLRLAQTAARPVSPATARTAKVRHVFALTCCLPQISYLILVCVDVNECLDGNNGGCDPLAPCYNSFGSHTCGKRMPIVDLCGSQQQSLSWCAGCVCRCYRRSTCRFCSFCGRCLPSRIQRNRFHRLHW
jgi:hypothetical protein